ncbi:uncharacterized protein NPIL_416391, partial [Nephila pilipes]
PRPPMQLDYKTTPPISVDQLDVV